MVLLMGMSQKAAPSLPKFLLFIHSGASAEDDVWWHRKFKVLGLRVSIIYKESQLN